MDYGLTEEQLALRDIVRRVAKEKVAPVAAKHDREGTFPWDMVKIFADTGFYASFIEEKYGGCGGGVLELAIITEELSRACGGIALAVAATALGTFPIIIAGNDEQKQRFLPRLAAGKILAGFGLTEPEAGSDPSNMKTRAVKQGDKYILNGAKCFITNGGVAKAYTIIAVTDPEKGTRGTSAFVVEEGSPGFSYGKEEDKMGIRASATRELVFQDCEIPAENLLGKEGQGFIIAMRTLDRSRPGVASQALGIAQGALDLALDYARNRVQFGQPVASHQGIMFMLADMATQIEAARALLYYAAREVDAGKADIGRISAMSKLFASDVAMSVTTDAVQIFGGYGYMRDYPIEKFMRDAKITQIYEGTNQIQRMVIGRSLIREGASKAS
jgi:butyryl-CoA dehydrogenase